MRTKTIGTHSLGINVKNIYILPTDFPDGSGTAVRVVLFDYRKAFDLIESQAPQSLQLIHPSQRCLLGGRFVDADTTASQVVCGILLDMGPSTSWTVYPDD